VASSLAIAALAFPTGLEAASPLAGFELRARSEHFAFYAREAGDKPDVRRSERFLAKVERELGHDVVGRSDYYIMEHQVDVFAATGIYSEGATFLADGRILSVRGYHPHELVHRVAGELGDPGLLFHEGLAVALGDDGRLGGKRVDDLAARALRKHPFEHYLEGFRAQQPADAYAVAGSLVSYLLRRHSPALLADFFRACGEAGQPNRHEFARIFGRSLKDTVGDWQREIQ
jgi:hypothetical protein